MDPNDRFPTTVVRMLGRLGERWMLLPWYLVAPVAGAFLLLKNGVSFVTGNVQNFYLPAAQALPQPRGFFSSSLGNLILARILGISDTSSWLLLHATLAAVALACSFVLFFRANPSLGNLSVVVLLTASGINVLFGSIGIYDPFTVVGAVILVTMRRLPFRLMGAAVMCLGNPEQALVAAACLLVLSIHPSFAPWRRTAAFALGMCTAWWLACQVWLALGGAGSRLVVLPYLLGQSLANFFTNPGFAIWSWLGCGWLVVLAMIVAARSRSRMVLVIALLILPAIVTILTADGARVFGIVVLPVFLIVSVEFWSNLESSSRWRNATLGLFVVLLVILPPVTGGWGLLGEVVAQPFVHGAQALYDMVSRSV